MMSTTTDHPGPVGNEKIMQERQQKLGIDTQGKAETRAKYLDLDYQIAEGADDWEKSGKSRVLGAADEDWIDEQGKSSQR